MTRFKGRRMSSAASTEYQRVSVTLVVVGDTAEGERVAGLVSDLALVDDAVQSFDCYVEADAAPRVEKGLLVQPTTFVPSDDAGPGGPPSSAATRRNLPYALRVQLACSYWQQATTTSPLPKEIK